MDSVFIQTRVSFDRNKPFFENRRNESFANLIEQARENDLNVFLSRINLYNKNKRSVNIGWAFENGKWIRMKDQKFDLVFYRGKNKEALKFAKHVRKLKYSLRNHYKLENICNDKILTGMVFPSLMPKTFLINNHYDLQKSLKSIKTDKVVLKPRYGAYGRSVIIIDKKDLRNGIKKDTVLQEFIDSSYGIKELKFRGYHDLRCIVIDGKIDHCYLRLPRRNSFLGNMSRGAKKIYVDKDDLPFYIKKKIKFIDNKMRLFGTRIYSADFLVDEDKKPWLIELNSKPGTFYYDNALRIRDRYHFNLTKSLKNFIENI